MKRPAAAFVFEYQFLLIIILDDNCFLSDIMMINSPPLQSDTDKRLRSSIIRNTKTDLLLIPPTSEKLDDINNNHYEHENNSMDSNNTIKEASLSSNDNENDATLLTTTTTTVEVKVKTTKTSSRKRKLNAINDMNSDNINKQQPVTKKKVIY
jgi:hypothetical protein